MQPTVLEMSSPVPCWAAVLLGHGEHGRAAVPCALFCQLLLGQLLGNSTYSRP